MIVIKSSWELARMREAGKIVAQALAYLVERIKPGMATRELDLLTEAFISRKGGVPSFKGYRGFPASLCVSVNDEVVHGIPGPRILKEGDIVSLDIGVIYQGYQGDAALTVGVGEISDEAKDLIATARGALSAGIAQAKDGLHVGDVSWAIQNYAESRGYSVVRQYTGHGIGRQMHEDPQVPNFGQPGRGPALKAGMTLALEPMVNVGGYLTRVRDDNWTVVTDDGKLSAHFEDTIVIREGEPEILTALLG
jgi:methionyl aminopeptidase